MTSQFTLSEYWSITLPEILGWKMMYIHSSKIPDIPMMSSQYTLLCGQIVMTAGDPVL